VCRFFQSKKSYQTSKKTHTAGGSHVDKVHHRSSAAFSNC